MSSSTSAVGIKSMCTVVKDRSSTISRCNIYGMELNGILFTLSDHHVFLNDKNPFAYYLRKISSGNGGHTYEVKSVKKTNLDHNETRRSGQIILINQKEHKARPKLVAELTTNSEGMVYTYQKTRNISFAFFTESEVLGSTVTRPETPPTPTPKRRKWMCCDC